MDQERYLTASAVAELTTLSRATIERKVRAGDMPAPIKISQRRKAWKASSIQEWMLSREAA